MSVLLKRHAELETVTVEPYLTVDGQGKPSYDTAAEIVGRVVREDDVARTREGDEIKSVATVWVDGEQSPLPVYNDRVTVTGLVGIVVEHVERRTLRNVLDHVRVKLREV